MRAHLLYSTHLCGDFPAVWPQIKLCRFLNLDNPNFYRGSALAHVPTSTRSMRVIGSPRIPLPVLYQVPILADEATIRPLAFHSSDYARREDKEFHNIIRPQWGFHIFLLTGFWYIYFLCTKKIVSMISRNISERDITPKKLCAQNFTDFKETTNK